MKDCLVCGNRILTAFHYIGNCPEIDRLFALCVNCHPGMRNEKRQWPRRVPKTGVTLCFMSEASAEDISAILGFDFESSRLINFEIEAFRRNVPAFNAMYRELKAQGN